jgi:hypothetical protein
MTKIGSSWLAITVTVTQLMLTFSLIPLSLRLYAILNEIAYYLNFA